MIKPIYGTTIFIGKIKLETFYVDFEAYVYQDLIHKAVGWMLREAGKRDKPRLMDFLDENSVDMPRTMLRYSIEKFTDMEREYYMKRKYFY